ncbi:MAG: ATP-binding protein [Candidatus Omnitrophota bacterium]
MKSSKGIKFEDKAEGQLLKKLLVLRQSQKKYREFVENANSIIMRMDTQGRIIFFNEFAERFFGFPRKEIVGCNVIGTIVPESDTSGVDLRAMIKDIGEYPGRYAINENENIRRNGERVWIAWTNKAVTNKTGMVTELLCIGNDITRRKRAEEALQQLTEQLEQRVKERTQELQDAYTKLQVTQAELIQAAKMQVVGSLASGVAHEVKNPLAIILQGADYLDKVISPDDENSVLVLKDIKEAVRRADMIIRDLLDFSRSSKLSFEPAGINPVIEKALGLLKMPLEKSRIQVTKELNPSIPEVLIDRNKIEQVLINLIMNAAQAIGEGGIISIRTYELGNEVVIEISDNGPGIPDEIMAKIFEPFFTTKRNSGGTGLGMPIVKNIIEMHNGRVVLSNRPEGGLRVIIALREA